MNVESAKLYIVDDDIQMCDLLEAYTCGEFNVIAHQSAKTFLASPINDSDIVLLDLKCRIWKVYMSLLAEMILST